MRQMALEQGFQDITQFWTEFVTTHPEVDRKIDEAQRKFGEENENFVLDAHLGFHCVPDACKILLTVSEEVAAERIFSAHRATESAKNIEESTYESTAIPHNAPKFSTPLWCGYRRPSQFDLNGRH